MMVRIQDGPEHESSAESHVICHRGQITDQ